MTERPRYVIAGAEEFGQNLKMVAQYCIVYSGRYFACPGSSVVEHQPRHVWQGIGLVHGRRVCNFFVSTRTSLPFFLSLRLFALTLRASSQRTISSPYLKEFCRCDVRLVTRCDGSEGTLNLLARLHVLGNPADHESHELIHGHKAIPG